MDCSECKYKYMQDYGYSNYTVEGTTFYCLKKSHPDDGFDRFYGEDARLDFASKCSEFEKGDGIDIDVDMEAGNINDYTDDPEIIFLYNKIDT